MNHCSVWVQEPFFNPHREVVKAGYDLLLDQKWRRVNKKGKKCVVTQFPPSKPLSQRVRVGVLFSMHASHLRHKVLIINRTVRKRLPLGITSQSGIYSHTKRHIWTFINEQHLRKLGFREGWYNIQPSTSKHHFSFQRIFPRHHQPTQLLHINTSNTTESP